MSIYDIGSGGYQGSWYVNPNTRTLTSDRKNTAVKDRDTFSCMQRLLNPVEDMVHALWTPIRLSNQTSVNRYSNSADNPYAERAFYAVGSRAPQEVKRAWMDAARETCANGLGIGANGMMTHISQMMVQRLKKSLADRGADENDILGNSASSALHAASQALYDLEHPLSGDNEKSLEVQYYRMKEKAFYQAFIRNLETLF